MDDAKTFRVHIDTEFTDFINCDLLSIGMVAQNGQQFYGENAEHIKSWASDWVKENIYPMLDFATFGKTRTELSVSAWEWLNDLPCVSVIITYDYKTDMTLLNDLFGGDKHPKITADENLYNNIYYDVDQMVLAMGGSSATYDSIVEEVKNVFETKFFEYLQTHNLQQHNALADARANKFAYDYIVHQFGIRI